MAVEYTLLIAGDSVDRELIDQLLRELSFPYAEHKDLDTGFRIDDFMDVTGFSLAFLSERNNPFGYEDNWLSQPFQSDRSITLRESRLLEWPQEEENMLRFFVALLNRMQDDVLLTLNYDYIHLFRKGGRYSIKVSAGIWQTPTGLAFLATTPHEVIP
ncbi:SitI3 family protein [Fibrella sp. WM1]|uniref:SitI3 family protein n=1 Tax=Fibrella musci TaxID=3242485 RepID=UPI0035223692